MKKTSIILFLIAIFGFLFRFINITQYNIYSDSYEFMLVAKNLVERFSLDGPLGKNGMYWGPLFYNRVGYGLFIAPIYWITKNLELSGHLLSFLSGLLSIILIYFITQKIFTNQEISFLSSLFLAISFSNVALAGFIMANSLIILFLIIFLGFFFYSLKAKNPSWFLISGFLLAFLSFLRIETAIIIFPALIFLSLKNQPKKIRNFLLAFFLAFILFALFFYLFLSHPQIWWQNYQIYLVKNLNRYAPLILFFLIIYFFLIIFLKKRKNILENRSYLFYFALVFFSLLITFFLPWFIYQKINWEISWFTFKKDYLIIILGFWGLIILLKKKFDLGLFFYLSLSSLLPIYFLFGQGLDFRHFSLLTPFLIITASFGTKAILEKLKAWLAFKEGWAYRLHLGIILGIIGLLFYGQIYQVIQLWHPHISYEKEIGLSLKKIIEEENIPANTFLLSAYPEAHYLYTGLSTWEEKKENPFIDNQISDEQKILVLVDEATRNNYPDLAHLMEEKFKRNSLKYIFTTVQYQYGNRSWWPKRLATVYYLKAGELKKAEK